MFFDHPIAALVLRLGSGGEVRPDVAVVLASVAELRRELGRLAEVLEGAGEGDGGAVCDVMVPMVRAYFAAVVVASQVDRVESERMDAFAEYADGVMSALSPRVGPGAREIAARVLGGRAPKARGRA